MGKNSTKLAVICMQNARKYHKWPILALKLLKKCVFLLSPHTFICRVPHNNWQAFQNHLQYIPYLTPPSPPSTLSPHQIVEKKIGYVFLSKNLCNVAICQVPQNNWQAIQNNLQYICRRDLQKSGISGNA